MLSPMVALLQAHPQIILRKGCRAVHIINCEHYRPSIFCAVDGRVLVDIRPYEGVGEVHFGMSVADAFRRLGEPSLVYKARSGEQRLDYGSLLLTFDEFGLAEVGLLPEALPGIAGILLLENEGFARLLVADGAAKEIVGFIVLLKFGVTITGMHDGDQSQLAATAFRRGRWDELIDRMKPFGRTG